MWSARGVYGVSGDEPHYLVMARGLLDYGSLEVTQPYLDEFASRAIYAPGLGPEGGPVQVPFAHVFVGDNGAFSWHGPAIAVLVAVPYLLGGVIGAKLIMIAVGAVAVLLAWGISGHFLRTTRTRMWAVLAVAFAYPLIPASNQIYPDLVAGTIALAGVAFLLARDRAIRAPVLIALSLAIGALPWLMMKFALPAAILGLAACWVTFRRTRRWSLRLALIAPALVLGIGMAAFNEVAFGSVIGVNPDSGLEASITALMVFAGLVLDQNQGILIQNLALWVGVFGLAAFARQDRRVFAVWALTLLSIWIPGAMHPGWYGGGSFFGRYSWALALLMIVPALAGYGRIAQRSRRWFAVLIALPLAWTAAHLAVFTLLGGASPGRDLGIDLFTRPTDTWLESYAVFAFPLQQWFPALYNDDWAFGFAPNAMWLLLLIGVALLGVRAKAGAALAAVAAAGIVITGVLSPPGTRSIEIAQGVTVTRAGPVAEGPEVEMRSGTYRWSIAYTSAAPTGIPAGRWELVNLATGAIDASGELPGSDGAPREEVIALPYRSLHPTGYRLRVAGYGVGPLTVDRTSVAHG